MITILARRWAGRDGSRDGMSVAVSYLAWTLAEMGHRVRCAIPADQRRPFEHDFVEWADLRPDPSAQDLAAELVISTIAPTWRRVVVAAQRAGRTSNLAFWHHHGSIPHGYGCTLARVAPGPPAPGWSREIVLPPASWALYGGGQRFGRCIVVPGVSRSKGGDVALAVSRQLTDVPLYVLPGRATDRELAQWRALPHATVSLPGIPPELWLSQASVLLSPSRAETYGLAMAEAAARGIPVVTSDLPGPRFALGSSATYLPLGAPAAQWAAAVSEALLSTREPLVPQPYRSVVAGVLGSLGMTAGDVPTVTLAPSKKPPRREWPRGVRLHIGCGPKRLAGWLNTDAVPGVGPDGVVDLHALALPQQHFAEIYSCHALEHCWPQDTQRILIELVAALQPGGTLRLSVPDLRLVVASCLDSQAFGGEDSALSVLFGGSFSRETSDPDRHRQAFWRERLERLMAAAGLERIRPWRAEQYPEIAAARDWSSHETISLNMEGDRPGTLQGSLSDHDATGLLSGESQGERSEQGWHPGQIDVSVILGTVRREAMLRECVEAIRAGLADEGPALRYEIVVAYGDEHEPSLPWMREQVDVRPIYGGMAGAIPAFNIAYSVSRGRTICQINDDVLVDPGSISLAVRHMDEHPDTAGVVFAFDRGDGRGSRHETLGGQLHPNQIVIRREAAEAVAERIGGFWGDAAHRTDKTYGGDSALGAVCHHIGLQLNAVPGVSCRDRMHEADDELRASNAQVDPGHGQRWSEMFGPLLRSTIEPGPDEWPHLYLPRPGMPPRRSPLAAGPPLRTLVIGLWGEGEPQQALRDALAEIGPYAEVPWAHLHASGGWSAVEEAVLEACRQHRPDLIWCQIQRAGWPVGLLDRARALSAPGCRVVNWTGDVETGGQERPRPWLLEMAAHVDLLLTSNCTYPRQLRDLGARCGLGYVQCGADLRQNTYRPGPERPAVMFSGANYRHLDGGERQRLFSAVAREIPGLELYGTGWDVPELAGCVRGPVDQVRCSQLYSTARAAISVSLFHDLVRYSSDRLKRALASGAVTFIRHFPDVEGLGIRDGQHALIWDTPEQLISLLREWGRPELAERRQELRQAAAEMARERYGWRRTVEELLAIVRDWRARRSA